ncbi:MAG: histidine phosphatase family protein, partial [Stellaceae bacterium]
AKGQERELAEKLASLDGVVVLVAWEHEAIVEKLLPAIAAGQHIQGMPTHWDGARFDVVLRFDRAAPGLPWSFRQLFPRLLSGDSDVPLQ